MSSIADHFIKDGTFGRRIFAMIASFYAIALLYGQKSEDGPARGYEVIASVLHSVGLGGPADWLDGTFVTALHTSPAVTVAASLVLAGAVLSMTATFRRTIYNVSPQAAFAFLFGLCVLVDLGTLSLRSAMIGTVVTAILVGILCLLPSEDQLTPAPIVALLIVLGPVAAVLYGPAKIISWLVSESLPQRVRVALEHGTGPVKIELVENTDPNGARHP